MYLGELATVLKTEKNEIILHGYRACRIFIICIENAVFFFNF